MNWFDYQKKWQHDWDCRFGEPIKEPWASIVAIVVTVGGVSGGIWLAVCNNFDHLSCVPFF